MIIIGCDFHTRFQQIAMVDPTTGEITEHRLEHENGAAERFYASLPSPSRVGKRPSTRSGSKECCVAISTNCGLETRQKFVQHGCASRKLIRATPYTFSIYSSRTDSRASGANTRRA